MTKPSASCNHEGCRWKVRATSLAIVFDELLKHEEESKHDRHKYGHIKGI